MIPDVSQERQELLQSLLDMGESMLQCGAEINRVEDTLSRIGKAFHAVRTDTFVITSSIVLTFVFEDNAILTQTRRIAQTGRTDFDKLERFNSLSRTCCSQPLPIADFRRSVDSIIHRKAPLLPYLIGNLAAALGFAIFFGGTLKDGIAALLLGLFYCGFDARMHRYFPNKVLFWAAASFSVGFLACLSCRILPFLNADKIMIGDIMLMIPGINMTNAVRDVLTGDTMSGLLKLTESLLWSCAIAGGFMVAIALIGV